MKCSNRSLAVVLSLLAGTAMSAPAFAQANAQNGAEADNGGIETIVVTARRTSENLQSTPVAVTALSTATLDRAQIRDVSQLQNLAPGLVVFPAVAQPGSAQFVLRGQGQNDGLIAVDQSVGAYVDGVYVARSSGALFNFVDVERIEVLRGPQGTLFGRNTTGGSVNVVTKAPSDHFEGMVRGRYGNYDAFEGTGMVNLPIKAANGGLRLVYQHTENKGYGRNVRYNQEVGGDKTDFVRGTLKVANSDESLKLSISGDYTNRRTSGEMIGLKSFTPGATQGLLLATCSGAVAGYPAPFNGLAALQPFCPYQGPVTETLAKYAVDVIGKGNFYDFYNSMPNIYGNAKTGGVSGTLSYDLNDDVTLKAITAWRKISTSSLSDNDGTPYVFTGGLAGSEGNQIGQEQISQELQLSGKTADSRLNYIVGAFYFRETGLDVSKSYALFPVSLALNYVDADVRNKSFALFGQATYNLTDTVRFTGGLRYTWDSRFLSRRNRQQDRLSGAQTCTMAGPFDATGFTISGSGVCQVSNSADYSYLSYTAGFDWQATSDLFLYVKTSRAYRSGGFNTRAVTGGSAVGFQPERVTDYEVGAKVDFFDRHARFNVAAFYTDYSNVQRNVPVVVPGSSTLTSGVQNAAKARVNGLEAELTVKPTNELTLGASATFLDPKFKSFAVPVTTLSGGTAIADASGTPYTLTPKTSFVLSADYEYPTDFGSVSLHADYAYRGAYYSQGPLVYAGVAGANGYAASFGFTNSETAKIPAYGLLNGQIAVKLNDPDLEVAFYGRNILKKKYFARTLPLEDTALGFTSYLPGEPRTYGVMLTVKY